MNEAEPARKRIGAEREKLASDASANYLLRDDCQPSINPADFDTCKRCGDRLRPGIAMQQTYTAGSPDLGECVTFSPGGPGQMIECRKCPACGWSMT